jgi:tetratricopeptide (TPR) repeat protein
MGNTWTADAVADYGAFLALAPPRDARRAEAILSRAAALVRRSEYAAAAADLRRMLRIKVGAVDRPDLLAFLCNAVAWRDVTAPEKERRPDETLPLARKAAEIEPFSVSYRNTLGAVLYRAGRYQEAADCLGRNLKDDPEFAGFDLYLLSMSLRRLGKATEARNAFDQAESWRQRRTGLAPTVAADLAVLRAEAAAAPGQSAP